MRMAPRAAAWVAWVAWTCNTGRKAGDSRKRADYEVRSFFAKNNGENGENRELSYCGAGADIDTRVFSDSISF
jgi:hypothetical protein